MQAPQPGSAHRGSRAAQERPRRDLRRRGSPARAGLCLGHWAAGRWVGPRFSVTHVGVAVGKLSVSTSSSTVRKADERWTAHRAGLQPRGLQSVAPAHTPAPGAVFRHGITHPESKCLLSRLRVLPREFYNYTCEWAPMRANSVQTNEINLIQVTSPRCVTGHLRPRPHPTRHPAKRQVTGEHGYPSYPSYQLPAPGQQLLLSR